MPSLVRQFPAFVIMSSYSLITASLVTAIVFHQLFEGLSLGIRIAALPPSPDDENLITSSESGYMLRLISCVKRLKNHWLQPSLSFSFAITTPIGILLGMSIFTQHHGE